MSGKEKKLTHVNVKGLPRMVDVGAKQATARQATAQAIVRFRRGGAHFARGRHAREGPVIDTAIIAGTMAVKRIPHELIPLLSPAGAIERCDFFIEFQSPTRLAIRCEVAITHKTGVEMEALTGASVAALTVYDMCKALSHEIVIAEIRLLEKSGGKRRVRNGKAST